MDFSKIGVIKLIASGIVGMGTGKIVAGIIKNNVKPETLIEKVTITAAAFVIGAMATTATKKNVEETVDEIAAFVTGTYDDVKGHYALVDALKRINKGESSFEDENLDAKNFRKVDGVWKHWRSDDPSSDQVHVITDLVI